MKHWDHTDHSDKRHSPGHGTWQERRVCPTQQKNKMVKPLRGSLITKTFQHQLNNITEFKNFFFFFLGGGGARGDGNRLITNRKTTDEHRADFDMRRSVSVQIN